MVTFICVEHILQFSESAISLVLEQVVALKFILDLTLRQLTFLIHLVKVSHQIDRVWVFGHILFPELSLRDSPDLLFHLFHSLLQHSDVFF